MLRALTAICLAIVFSAGGTHFAHAMSCDNKGAADRLHFGSNVSGEQVTICAEYWWPPSPAKKVVVAKKPSKPAKVTPNFFVVSPIRPHAFTANAPQLAVGDEFTVATTASSHFRKNTLLGRLAVVRFTPIRTVWTFGDGAHGWVPRASHSFSRSGTFKVSALVTFGVRFRFVGTTRWFSDPRGISIKTNTLTFRVGDKPPPSANRKPVLVLFDCMGVWRLGC
jgi:hypothetical protein